MNIDNFLDRDGKGVLTEELYRIFVANGCRPECHICDKKLKEGEQVHLKAFFVKTSDQELLTGGPAQAIAEFIDVANEDFAVPQVDGRGKTTSSIDVMICMACSRADRPLPRGEADKLLAVAHVHGMIESAPPESSPNMGRIGPQTYSYSTGARYQGRSGGCMIVRKAGETVSIIAGESK